AGVPAEDVLEITIVGNPIMHHLFLGIDPTPLGSAPFALATDGAVRIRAREVELPAHEGARVYVLPCIAGHVGADAAGAILAETPYDADEITLLVDVGTNAEIVLGSRDRLLAASSPTGPPSRAPRSRAASGPRRARSNGSASTGRRSSLASGSSARRAGRTRPGSRPRSAGPA